METQHFEALYPKDSYGKEIKKLHTYIKEGNSIQVIGLPGVGKSNLLKTLTYNKVVRSTQFNKGQEWIHFVYLNFAEIRERPLLDVTKFIFISLLDSVAERQMTEVYEKLNQLFKEVLLFQDELVLFQALKKAVDIIAIENQLTIVLLFDRFEEYIPSVSNVFFSNLRVLRDRAKYRFSCVFAVNRPLEDVLDTSIIADFYEFIAGHSLFLPLYDNSVQSFRISYLEKTTGKKISHSQLVKVFELTGRHSKLTRICIEVCLEDEVKKDNLVEFLLKQPNVNGVLKEIWYALTPAEQTHLKKMTSKDLPNDTHEFLILSGLIKENTIQIPLLKDYIKNLHKIGEETYFYNNTTHIITNGQHNISDLLTKAEFKLLKILLEHKDEIVDRNTIIATVWDENKSTTGITDQALDQLIFRLRKKIEENVNLPKHIITIKGRGIRFNP